MTNIEKARTLRKAWEIIGELDIKPLEGQYDDAVADPKQEMTKYDVILSNKIADIQLCQYHIKYCQHYIESL